MMLHRWLRIRCPDRGKRDPSPDLTPLSALSVPCWGMEVSRTSRGRILFRVVAPDTNSLTGVAHALELTFPEVAVLGAAPCAVPAPTEGWRFARARPSSRDHYWPLAIPAAPSPYATDFNETLVTMLADPALGDAEVHLQVLGRRVGAWESGLFSSRYSKLVLGLQGQHSSLLDGSWTSRPTSFDEERLRAVQKRQTKVPLHVEIRVAWRAPQGLSLMPALRPWLDQWTLAYGMGAWRYWDEVRPWPIAKDRVQKFAAAFAAHDLKSFAGWREARDVSAEEFATMVAPPWRRDHTNILGSVKETHPKPSPPRSSARSVEGTLSRVPPAAIPGGTSDGAAPPHTSALRDTRGVLKLELPPMALRSSTLPVAHPSTRESPANPAPAPRVHAEPSPAPQGWLLGRRGDAQLRLPEEWRHMAIIGGTGTGKSTLLLNLILQAVNDRRRGTVVVLDPTGALVRDVKARLPLDLARDTVEFDPSHLCANRDGVDWASPGFNLLSLQPKDRADPAAFDRAASVISSDLIRSFHDTWGPESVGARAAHFLTSILKGLMRRERTNLLDVRAIIVNREARERYIRSLPPGSDYEVSFVRDELPKYRQENFISTLDKTGWFGGSRILRSALCQRDHPADFQAFLGHRLVLLNVSRGLVGDQNSRILGSAFLAMLWSARLTHGEGGSPLTLVIDEAQNFALPSLQQMLSEGRKYGVRVVLANQYIAQLPDELWAAMQGNVDSWCCFRVGPDDAHDALQVTKARWWDGTEQTFTDLPDHEFVSNVVTHTNRGWWMALPPPPGLESRSIALDFIHESTRRYATLETSEVPPFLAEPRLVGQVLKAVAGGASRRSEIAESAGVPVREAVQALWRGEDLGYAQWDPQTEEYRVTPLGQTFVEAWGARRVTETEGELHMDLLARAVGHIRETWGVEVNIARQGANPRPLPDGTFEKDGIPCSLEVECSTLATKRSQVVKNIRKARDEGRLCLCVVRSLELADRLIQVAGELAPELKLGRDFAILYGVEGKLSVLPEGMSADGFPFVSYAEGRPVSQSMSGAEVSDSTPRARDDARTGASDKEIVGRAISVLRKEDKAEVTQEEVLAKIPESDRGRFCQRGTGKPSNRLGMTLSALSTPWRRPWVRSRRNNSARVYLIGQSEGPAPQSPCPPEQTQEAG